MNKAETLFYLSRNIESVNFLPQVSVKYDELNRPRKLLTYINNILGSPRKFAVRSSFSQEDQINNSMAGKYESFIEVDYSEVIESIKRVFDSFGENLQDEIVLVQPYLESSSRSGVLFSHNPETGVPYQIDNYTLSSDTTAITSGISSGVTRKCFYSGSDHDCFDKLCKRFVNLIAECQTFLDYETLDIEYAYSEENDEITVLQVRPLKINKRHFDLPKVSAELNQAKSYIAKRIGRAPFLAGSRTIFAVMPDWNPAEMIGRKPRNLALSLYRELITDSIWAYQRDNYGYKTLRSVPLLVEICGQPYIDVRVSFNSLLPKGLRSQTEETLINYYLDRLAVEKELHDKVEFEIVLSSWTFEINERLEALGNTLSKNEKHDLLQRLVHLTKSIITGDYLQRDIDRINILNRRMKALREMDCDSYTKIFWLIEDCKRWGTLPFAGIARAAFIATQIIKSIERTLSNPQILQEFTEDLDLITSRMGSDFHEMSKESFLEIYGHLRPGTYDITSLSYREGYEHYFLSNNSMLPRTSLSKRKSTHQRMVKLINDSGISEKLGVSGESFVEFADKAITWREQAKFEFTKHLSEVLNLLVKEGDALGYNREDLSFLNIHDLMTNFNSSKSPSYLFERSIIQGRDMYESTLAIDLPSVITSASDVEGFLDEDLKPNFVSSKRVIGNATEDLSNLDGKIIFIRGADPGYDWIFQHNVLGLVTAYGGANSHMAIRCAEANIPAAIGIGERRYQQLIRSKLVILDCTNEIIDSL